jgi:hypothetical protein
MLKKEGQKDHLFKRIAKMETITSLCVGKKVAHKHVAPIGGHHGEKTTKELLGKTFYWSEMKEDVEHYIRTCVKCQSTKSVHKKKFRLYGPLPIPLGPFESVSMDFMTCFLEWEGTNAIFVAVDKFLKLMKFAPTQTNAIAVGMTKLFFNMRVWHNGTNYYIIILSLKIL